MGYNSLMEILETPVFSKQVQKVLTDEEYRALQNVLILNPLAGDLIQQSGGLRKIRVGSKGQGKRSGSRAIYYWFCEKDQLMMLLIYSKSSQEDLTPDQKKVLRQIIESED